MLVPLSTSHHVPRPATPAESMSSVSSSSISTTPAPQNILPVPNAKLGKQPLPKELDWEIYKEQVLDHHITEALLGESEDDLTSGPYSLGKAKFNDVLAELLAIQFARTKLEGVGRPGTGSSSSMIATRSIASAEGSGSKRNTQDTMLTVPPEVGESSARAAAAASEDPIAEIPVEEPTTERRDSVEESKPEGPVAQESLNGQPDEKPVEAPTEEPERPASRASTSSSSSEEDVESNRLHVEGPIHTWLPAMPRYQYMTKRQKIKRAIWKVRSTPHNVSVSVKKAVLGTEPWSNSPYFLHDEYSTTDSKGLIEKFKFEFKEPDLSTPAGKIYARACEPFFRQPGTTKRECASCMELFNVLDVITLECDHKFCEECLRIMVMTASQQEATMPPSCCKMSVRPNVIKKVLKTQEDRVAFSRKVIEYDTSIDKRLFCPKKKCGAFIPYHPLKDKHHPLVGHCQKCGTRACRICKGKAHKYAEDCPQDMDLNAVLELSSTKGWRRCYRCRAMIELNYGCTHMTCRCGAEFCYLCGNQWSIEYGCPIGCIQGDHDIVQQIANEIAEVERLRLEAEAAANDPAVRERLRQEEEAKIEAEERLKRTLEDFKITALTKTQKEEQAMFAKYTEGVVFKLRQRHYEEMTDLQLEHVGEFLAHNSELEDRTVEFSQSSQAEEEVFCEKLGMTEDEVKRSPHEEDYSALCYKHRVAMLKMKETWDKEHRALKWRQAKAIDKLRQSQDLEERVVYVELEERKTNFVTDQRNVLARMLEFRRIATGLEFADAEFVYSADDLKIVDDETIELLQNRALLDELTTLPIAGEDDD
ncbi:hypothetical protein ABW19_dt0204402 [Dactylella cylindrospora]|nr:hypothetical protein ABW19_dt0204402 [Dactylella cylindrospora]